MRIEWRRDEPSAAEREAPGTDGALTETMRRAIEAAGPFTFADFMERALYDPEHGYYAIAAHRPTRSGDFLTAPELHPIFGRTLAVQVDEMWQRLGRPTDFVIQEHGAGSGALFSALLEGLERVGSALAQSVRYEPVDFARQRAVIADRLAASGRAAQVVPIGEHTASRTGVVIANEFLDALPVHRVIRMNDELREIHVDWRDDGFTQVAGPPADERTVAWFASAGIELVPFQRAEVNLRMLDWVQQCAAQLQRGYVMVIDYGAGARDLYAPERIDGTIRAFSGQRVSSDVLSDPGSRDITSSVDFDALEREARAFGFTVAGRRRANEFLLAAGLDDAYARARAESAQDWDEHLNLRLAIQRLLDPNALGGYLVTILAKDAPVEPPLRGLAPLPGGR